MNDTPEIKHSHNDSPETAANTWDDVPEIPGYAIFRHSWRDEWAKQDVKACLHFRKPGQEEMNRYQREAQKSSGMANRNILVETIHPDEKEQMLGLLKSHVALSTTITNWMMKASGFDSVGN